MEDWVRQGDRTATFHLKKMDPSFLEHIRQQHIPYRRDCKYCVQGGAKHRQHRRILAPQAWTLSVDTAGPFVQAVDEISTKAKYFIIGVLTVPKIIAVSPTPPEAEGPPEHGIEADPEPAEEVADALEAADWMADPDIEPERPKPATPKEEEQSKEAWKLWAELVDGDQQAWRKEADIQFLPKMEMVDWLFLEPVPSKSTSDVLNAVGRMYASAKSDGFDVRRIHWTGAVNSLTTK